MVKINQRNKNMREAYETEIEREQREFAEIDAYHQELENRENKIYIRTEYLD